MKHILFDLEGCDKDLLDDARFVRNSLFHASILSNSKILKIDFHQFYPQGVTGFALLADSHISIHTCLLYTSPSPRDGLLSRMPSSA